jgi:hypothetical protein
MLQTYFSNLTAEKTWKHFETFCGNGMPLCPGHRRAVDSRMGNAELIGRKIMARPH